MSKKVMLLILALALVVSSTPAKASEQLAENERAKGIASLEAAEYERELYLMAHLINAEAGSDWCSDDLMRYVGSVALNRVEHSEYPDTLYEVIYQTEPCIQYACTVDGNFYKEPNERAWRIAKEILDGGSVLPSEVVYQAQFKQGSEVYTQEQNTYFCIY